MSNNSTVTVFGGKSTNCSLDLLIEQDSNSSFSVSKFLYPTICLSPNPPNFTNCVLKFPSVLWSTSIQFSGPQQFIGLLSKSVPVAATWKSALSFSIFDPWVDALPVAKHLCTSSMAIIWNLFGPDEIALTTRSSLKLSTLSMTKNSEIGFFSCSTLSAIDIGILLTVPSRFSFSPMIIDFSLLNFFISLAQLLFNELIPAITKQCSTNPLRFKVSAKPIIWLVFPQPGLSSKSHFFFRKP